MATNVNKLLLRKLAVFCPLAETRPPPCLTLVCNPFQTCFHYLYCSLYVFLLKMTSWKIDGVLFSSPAKLCNTLHKLHSGFSFIGVPLMKMAPRTYRKIGTLMGLQKHALWRSGRKGKVSKLGVESFLRFCVFLFLKR